jgi:hypothetical protein
MHTYIHTFTYVCNTYTLIHMYVCMYVYIYIYIYIYTERERERERERENQYAALRAAGDVRDAELKASYASTLRPHTLVAEGLIHW